MTTVAPPRIPDGYSSGRRMTLPELEQYIAGARAAGVSPWRRPVARFLESRDRRSVPYRPQDWPHRLRVHHVADGGRVTTDGVARPCTPSRCQVARMVRAEQITRPCDVRVWDGLLRVQAHLPAGPVDVGPDTASLEGPML